MPAPKQEDVEFLLNKYKQKLAKKLDIVPEAALKPAYTREYKEFRREYLKKKFGWYEKACHYSERILKLKPDKKKAPLIQEAIDIAHLNVTPTGVTSFSILGPILLILLGSMIFFAVFNSLFFVIIFLISGIVIMRPLAKYPFYAANNWRMKASNQMVLCIFYIVTFMRHTSNLEAAIKFAADHLSPPLALDLKKVIWDVETSRYESVKESLDAYLETWRKWNLEFIEAFHLIESSLYEPSEDRRLTLLDKSLDVILSETYEKMLHYAHNLNSPITMLHMLGIILPILGLVILPLVVNFMGEVKWYHIATLYNLLLPVGVYFYGRSILSKRPTGYGDTDIADENPELKKYKNIRINLLGLKIAINPLAVSIVIGIVLLFIGLSPLIMHSLGVSDFGAGGEDISTGCGFKFCMLEYRISKATSGPIVGQELGPFGLGASILSLAITLSLGLSIGLYYRLRSKNIIKIRRQAKKLEDEFASAIFQLGNRLGDGVPAEIAFGRVADIMKDTVSGNFFSVVSNNIRSLGMSVQDAIFNPRTGALVYFPSKVIESSMKMLVQSIKKGPKIAAQALTNISRYIKEIHKVNERLKDLMAEIISSMKSQIRFMAPAIAGIVVGITSMITNIIGKLGRQLAQYSEEGAASQAQSSIVGLFGDGIPTYYFQIVVGIYIIQIIYILTVLSNGIENGADKLSERYSLGQNMIKSTILFCLISLFIMLVFNLIAGTIMQATGIR